MWRGYLFMHQTQTGPDPTLSFFDRDTTTSRGARNETNKYTGILVSQQGNRKWKWDPVAKTGLRLP